MYALIDQFFEDAISEALAPTYVRLENVVYMSENGVPYAKLSHLRGPRRTTALGSKQILYQGIVQVDILTPANSGPGSSEVLLSKVEAEFDNGMQFDISGSQLSITSVSRGVSSEDPVWYTVPVSIYWSLRQQK